MKIFKKKKQPMNKKITIPLVIFAILLAARIAIIPVIQKQLNQFLATFSPTLYFHMDDLDIHLIRGAYSFDGVTGKVKGSKRDFLKIGTVDVSIAWRELFKGKVVTDIEVTGVDFSYTGELKNAIASSPKKKDQATAAKDKLFPVKVERVDLASASITLDDYPSLEEGKKFQVTNVEGRITNLTPDKKFPLSFFNLKATILGNSMFKTTGHLNTLAKPLAWDVDGEMQGFDLTKANQFLLRKLPLTFTKGKLDLYAEAESQNGKLVGYVKPFMKNVDVIKNKEQFVGVKHWFVEVLAALGNLILRTSDTKSVATKIPFSMDQSGFHVDSGEALSKAIQNGFQQKLSPGIEDKYELK
jgi:hypothetical protein